CWPVRPAPSAGSPASSAPAASAGRCFHACSLLLYRSDRTRHQLRAPFLHEAAHLGVVEEGGFGRPLALFTLALDARVQGLARCGGPGFEADLRLHAPR